MANKIVTFTPKQMADSKIAKVVDFLGNLASDGEITADEMAALSDLFSGDEIDQSVPGVEYLREALSGIDFTQPIEIPKRAEIHRAILRVLPKSKRTEAEQARRHAGMERAAIRERDASLPTERQINYITSLGGDPHSGMSRDEASAMIDERIERSLRPLLGEASQRQIDYIIDLGGYAYPGMTREEASIMIDSLKNKPVKTGCFSVILLFLTVQTIAVSAWFSFQLPLTN